MKQRVVILMHTDYPLEEGLSYRVRQMAESLSVKYDVTVLSPKLENKDSPVREKIGNYEVCRVALRFPKYIETNRVLFRFFFILAFTFSMIRLWRSMSGYNVKLVQAEQQLSLLPAFILSHLFRVPLVVDDALGFEKYYEHYPRYLRIGAWIFEMLLFHSCSLIICSYSHITHSFPKIFKISPLKMRVVVNGVKLLPAIQHLSLNKGSKDVVFVASMYSQQNLNAIKNLVKIFTAISNEVESTRLFIIGGPTYMLGSQFLREIKKLPKVFVLGRISEEEKNRYLRSASVCPLPFNPSDTLMGGIRLKSLECLASGKVVISSSSGVEGVTGVLDGVNLIIRDDFKEFEKCMMDILQYPEKYEQIRANAVELASNYRWENILPSYLKIIENFR